MPLGTLVDRGTCREPGARSARKFVGAQVRPHTTVKDQWSMQGVLTDTDIRAEVAAKRLIVENFDKDNVHQSCYELRAGSKYFDLSNDNEEVDVADDGQDYILLKPNQAVAVQTLEELKIPADMVGRIILKGGFFSLGILPVSTYADPGFRGRLGVVLHNASPHYLRIDPGQAIAKIEFERLHSSVVDDYKGQHGFGTGIWPYRKTMIVSPADAHKHKRYTSFPEESRRALGPEISGAFDRVFGYSRRATFAIVLYTGLSVLMIALNQGIGFRVTTVTTVVIGVVTNLLTSALLYFWLAIRRPK